MPSRRRKSLPISLPETHIHRTDSEQQLHEDMVVAEIRETHFFNRLISGIRQRQQLHYNFQSHAVAQQSQLQRQAFNNTPVTDDCNSSSHPPSIQDTEQSIENIISTRCNAAVAEKATMAHLDSDFMNLWIGNGCDVENKWDKSKDNSESDDNGWAIEGFDAAQDEKHYIENEDDEHSHHVFDIEL